MRLAPVLLIALLLAAPKSAPDRPCYQCDLRPGPPLRVRVYHVDGQRRAVGPELTYRHPGKMASAADIDNDGRLDLLYTAS